MNITYTHVRFTGGYPQVTQWVPLAEAPAYYLDHQTHNIDTVRVDVDGEVRETFGKQWMTWTGQAWELAGIGAGCYCGMNVATYPDVKKRAVRS